METFMLSPQAPQHSPDMRHGAHCRVVAMALALMACACNLSACYYTEFNFDKDKNKQITAIDLLNNHYSDPWENEKDFFASQLAKHERNRRPDDPDWVDTYGFLLLRRGRTQEAFSVWRGLLAKQPDRYSTLCNIATSLHNMGKYDEATTHLTAAINLKPGFRSGAEELHLELIQYQNLRNKDSKKAITRLFVDSLSDTWNNRKPLPWTFQEAKDFPDIKADGVAELLRQFPKAGDAWLVLGMILEHQGNHYYANRAYERAAKFGSMRGYELKDRLESYTPFAMERDPTRVAGNRMKWAILALFIGFIGWWAVLMVRRAVLDYTDIKKRKPPSSTKRK